jgi:hypothetical protein
MRKSDEEQILFSDYPKVHQIDFDQELPLRSQDDVRGISSIIQWREFDAGLQNTG